VSGRGLALMLAVGGIAMLLLALAVDRRARAGILPRGGRAFRLEAAYLIYFATTAAAAAFALYAPVMLQFSAGLSALEAGYLVALEALAWTAAALSAAGASPIWRGRLVRIGAAAILAGITGVTLAMAGGSLLAVGLFGALLGSGFGLSYAFLGQRVIGSFDEATRARGSAAIGAVRNAGGAVGAALAGIAANAAGFGQGLSDANFSAIAWLTFGTGIPFALAGLICAIRLAGAWRPDQAGRASGISAAP
jgi:hypothetical protein